MTGKLKLKTMMDVAEIRDLQHLKAEMEASRAAADLRDRQSALKKSVQERDALEEAWRGSLHTRSYDLQMAILWSSALLQQEQQINVDQVEVDKAHARVGERSRDLHAARMRKNKADEMRVKAAKAAVAHKDDRRLAEATDGHAVRRSQS